jgi:hypothetical protein
VRINSLKTSTAGTDPILFVLIPTYVYVLMGDVDSKHGSSNVHTYIPFLLPLLYISVPELAENKIEAGTDLGKAVISLENTQIRRYALEPAGTFFSDAGHCFQMVSSDLFLYFL